MKNFEIKKEIWIWLVMLLPILYLAYVWPDLPETIPTHFGADGKPNGWSSKSDFKFMVPGLVVGIYLLMTIIPLIDPKGKIEAMGKKYFMLKFFLMLFMNALCLFIIRSAITQDGGNPEIMFLLVGGMFAFLGNYMQTVKPNYFIGIRTPWTLENEVVWRKTHKLGGKLFLVAGVLMMVLPFILKARFYPVFVGLIAVAAAIPIVYSFIVFTQERRKSLHE